ncbi:MAG: enoyl-CoA hydratase-related protein [Chloroflexi bacterium]|nr:enoyl-CoA hydratase-related protein [Chloroflexota bacterium]
MDFEDILYEKKDGIARITMNRPRILNAFRTLTLKEMTLAFQDAEDDQSVGVVILTGAGDRAFCVGGDSKESPDGGYPYDNLRWHSRLHQAIRFIPKPVIAAVNGWCIGGGNVMCTVADLAIASETARFGQAGPKVGSFDAGFGAAYLSRIIGEKKAREFWFLCRNYSAQEALEMGLINKVVAPDKLMEETEAWCREILALSPTSLRFLKTTMNADSDSIFGLAGTAASGLWLYWQSEEAKEGRKAYEGKRRANWEVFRI